MLSECFSSLYEEIESKKILVLGFQGLTFCDVCRWGEGSDVVFGKMGGDFMRHRIDEVRKNQSYDNKLYIKIGLWNYRYVDLVF